MEIVAVATLRYQGVRILPGALVDIVPDEAAQALVARGEAKVPKQPAPQKPAQVTTPPPGDEQPPGQVDAEEKEKQAKALNAQYTRDALAEAAKLAGVEFPYDARKDDIVAAVINQGKAAVLLK